MRLTAVLLPLVLQALPLAKAHLIPAEQDASPLVERASKPSQNSDGSCYAYSIQSGEGCSQIASKFGLTQADLSTFNDKKTWGWTGCNPLQLGNICVSTGSPPLPAPVSNAKCGPTVPGTQKPASNVDISTLNPCPLNACCNKWGQCGITPDFCSPDTGPTGNPGTAPAGKNGCVSNCGTYIANLQKPSTQVNVAYFETWNWDRPCLNMRVTDVDRSQYTHIHWAFATVDPNSLQLVVNDTYGEWKSFKSLTGVKRIISIGGWGFSTGYDTYDIFRRATKGADQNLAFANNIINFLKEHNLDGVDLDWEYPGAPDNQGLPYLPPKGDPWDGGWYYILLKNLRQNMPAGKTVSIAAPASYWYLQGFPIKDMATQLDYIVYMTYDLHGQWDYNNKWTSEGCPGGNCLRSHVNNTETAYALAMITKAGVPTNKIVVGVSSYGRSFGMVDKNCDGEMCLFKGPDSAATKGRCTGTAGYIGNAEINEIIAAGGSNVRTRFDTASGSNILVYGDQYVAYMNDTTKASRKSLYQAYYFLGTADWAVDLQAFPRPKWTKAQPQPGAAQWDLTPGQIVAQYGTGDWDLNTHFVDICVFYHGSFRDQAEAYLCANPGRYRMMADLFIPQAFDNTTGPRASAKAAGMEREWFRRLSEIFAQVCYGQIRLVWDGVEAMNIGDMATPTWHSQWDWYELPILQPRIDSNSARLMVINPSRGFRIEGYTTPTDHSTPPPGFAPPKNKRRDALPPAPEPGSFIKPPKRAVLEKRVDPANCMADSTCQQCVYSRIARFPNSEVAYANFDDKRPWNQGTCKIMIDQYRKLPETAPSNYSTTIEAAVQDDELYDIGGTSRDMVHGFFSAIQTNLINPVWVRTFGSGSGWAMEFEYVKNHAKLEWNLSKCGTGLWQYQQNGPSGVDDDYKRHITCFFPC